VDALDEGVDMKRKFVNRNLKVRAYLIEAETGDAEAAADEGTDEDEPGDEETFYQQDVEFEDADEDEDEYTMHGGNAGANEAINFTGNDEEDEDVEMMD
jgi:hypothetical protein